MKRMKNYILLVAILGIASHCHKDTIGVDRAYKITIYNNSSNLVYYFTSFAYPDTTIPNEQNNLSGIKPKDYTYKSSTHDWDRVFAEKNASKISFFFFSPDTITKYGWDNVRNNYQVLKRKDLSLENLKSNNYKVSYP